MKEYALYKGEDLLEIGTIKEIATRQNVKYDTIRFYGTSIYKKRIGFRKRKGFNARILVKL